MQQLLHSVEVIYGDTGSFRSLTCSLLASGTSPLSSLSTLSLSRNVRRIVLCCVARRLSNLVGLEFLSAWRPRKFVHPCNWSHQRVPVVVCKFNTPAMISNSFLTSLFGHTTTKKWLLLGWDINIPQSRCLLRCIVCGLLFQASPSSWKESLHTYYWAHRGSPPQASALLPESVRETLYPLMEKALK